MTVLDHQRIPVVDASITSVQQNKFSSDKTEHKFREYVPSADSFDKLTTVAKTYFLMHKNQTVDYVLAQKKATEERLLYNSLGNQKQMTIWDVMNFMDTFVDESDPDTTFGQSVHAFQAAEAARSKGLPDWFQLTALIHDLGKVLCEFQVAETAQGGNIILSPNKYEQWSIVGDTYVVGAQFESDKIVYGEFFKECPDFYNENYNTKYGIYQPNCGLDKLHMSFGHDEYLYQVCVNNGTLLPEEALYCIRFHSCYPWHNKRAYTQFETEKDQKMLSWVQLFQTFDLYSKQPELPKIEELKPYYSQLIDKYFPKKVMTW